MKYNRVKVYRNLHKKCWSVVSMEGSDYGKVIGHEKFVMLDLCDFKVSEKSRQRVIREKRKNVHAWVVGFGSTACWDTFDYSDFEPIYYNPYTTESFINFKTGEAVHHAQMVVFDEECRVFYK